MESKKPFSLFDENNPILKNITSKFTYFYYLNNINQRFDVDLEDYHFDDDKEISKSSMEDIETFSSLTKSSKVLKIVNSVFDKVAHITSLHGLPLFVDNNANKNQDSPSYIVYDSKNDLSHQTLGNVHTDKMYAFKASVEENSYLYRFIDTLQIMFYLEQDTNRVLGGFSLNKLDNSTKTFNGVINDFYLVNLVNSFIKDQLYPYDLEAFLDIDPKKYNDTNVAIKEELLTVDNPNFKLLKNNWERLITTKYIKHRTIHLNEEDVTYLKDTLFYCIMTSWLIMILVLEELDEYFSNAKGTLINDYEKHQHNIEAKPSSENEAADDFIAIVNSLRKDKINDLKLKKLDNYSFSEPHLVYDVHSHKELFLINSDYLISNHALTSLLITVLFKENYGITDINANFLNLEQFKDVVRRDIEKGFSTTRIEKYKQTICERNFYYVSFINEGDVVILHNNISDEQRQKYSADKITNYYLWAMVFIVSKELENSDLDFHVDYLLTSNQKNKVIFYRQIIRDIEDIRFNYDDEFFGIKQIKKIVFAMEKQVHLITQLNSLQKQVKDEDEIFKRQTERSTIITSFIVALLIGYVDFLACVFSILPCSWAVVPWSYILGTIGFTTFTTAINLLILVITIIYLGKLRLFYKAIDSRSRRIRFEGSKSPKFIPKN